MGVGTGSDRIDRRSAGGFVVGGPSGLGALHVVGPSVRCGRDHMLRASSPKYRSFAEATGLARSAIVIHSASPVVLLGCGSHSRCALRTVHTCATLESPPHQKGESSALNRPPASHKN